MKLVYSIGHNECGLDYFRERNLIFGTSLLLIEQKHIFKKFSPSRLAELDYHVKLFSLLTLNSELL